VLDLVWLIPALPLAGFAIILLFGRRLGDPKAGYLATLMCSAAFVVTVGIFFDLLSKPTEERQHVYRLFSWVPVSSLKVDLSFLVDPLSITMCLFVTGVGAFASQRGWLARDTRPVLAVGLIREDSGATSARTAGSPPCSRARRGCW